MKREDTITMSGAEFDFILENMLKIKSLIDENKEEMFCDALALMRGCAVNVIATMAMDNDGN